MHYSSFPFSPPILSVNICLTIPLNIKYVHWKKTPILKTFNTCARVCVHGMANCNMIFFLFRIAEPWQQLSSKGCICGSVMGSQWCAGQAGSLFHRLRDGMCKAVAGAGSRRAWIMNSIFSACLLCPPLSTKLYLDIKRCHRPCSVTAEPVVMIKAENIGGLCRSEAGQANDCWQNDMISVSPFICQMQHVLICAVMVGF